MSQTQRTLAEIYALLADNTTASISPTDLRDAIETLRHTHGELSLSASSLTTINTVDVWEKVAGTTAASPNAFHGMSMPTDCRLLITSAAPRLLHIAVSLSVTPASSNKVFEFVVAKNGDPDDVNSAPSLKRANIPSSVTVAFAFHALIPVVNGDYVEVFARNTTDATNITVETLNFVAIGMPNG